MTWTLSLWRPDRRWGLRLWLLALVGGAAAVAQPWRVPSLALDGWRLVIALVFATLAAEIFTVDFPDRKRVSGSYVFLLVSTAILGPAPAALIGGLAGGLGAMFRRAGWHSMLFQLSRLALAAACAAGVAQWVAGELGLGVAILAGNGPAIRTIQWETPSGWDVQGALLQTLAFMAVFTLVAMLLARVDRVVSAIDDRYPGVDLLTNALIVPLPVALLAIYARTGANGLMLAVVGLVSLLAIVRAYVNLGTLHGDLERAYELAEERQSKLTEALQLNRDITQLINHDLRGPLSSVMGYTELLGRTIGRPDANVEQQREQLKRITSNSQRILRLADNLFDLQRLEQAESLVELAPFDPRAVLLSVIDQLRDNADRRRIRLRIDAADEVGRVVSNEWMFREIADNLLSNAIKYGKDGGSVDVKLGCQHAKLQLQVLDDGIGMTPDDQARLFTKFFRSAAKEVRGVQGSGLGLALCKTMIDKLGGEIEVWSEPARGTRFTVRLPDAGMRETSSE
ncbi:MAG: HAMP domain-containing histidine kinase [Chloroflexota bacterium]|nr:HAMP domain-containing histidine kinase [Chloroflexota bacterium]